MVAYAQPTTPFSFKDYEVISANIVRQQEEYATKKVCHDLLIGTKVQTVLGHCHTHGWR